MDQIKLDGVEITKTFEIVDGKGKFTQASRGEYTLEIPYGTTTVAYDCCKVFQSGLLAQAVTKLVLPDTVTTIEDGTSDGGGSGAFTGILANSLREIILSKNLSVIGKYAFHYFYANGKSIIIPKSVREIHSYAFDSPSYSPQHFENVYYEGTQEEWNSIAIGSGNDMLIDATHIHYNYQPE